jgi:ribosomal protein S18 acetylase RimI-like enzyme
MTARIRAMAPKDKGAVMQILKGTVEFEPYEVVVAEELIDCFLHDPANSGYHILVAEKDTEIEGYVCFGPTPLTSGTWDIYWIAVSPLKKDRGIGKYLMTFAEERIRNTEGRLIMVETSSKPSYDNTRIFYEHRGYRQVACIADFYSPHDDKVIFEKRL